MKGRQAPSPIVGKQPWLLVSLLFLLTGCVSSLGPRAQFAHPLQTTGPAADNPHLTLSEAETNLAEGRLAAAMIGFDSSARSFAARQDLRPLMEALYGGVQARLGQQDIVGARQMLLDALNRMLPRPYPDWYAHFMLTLAEIERQRGDLGPATLACLRGLQTYQVTTSGPLISQSMLYCTDLLAEQGRADLANKLLNKALSDSLGETEPLLLANVLVRQGLLLASTQPARAGALLKLASDLYAQALDFEAALAAQGLQQKLGSRVSVFGTKLAIIPTVSPAQARGIYKGLDCYLRNSELVCDLGA